MESESFRSTVKDVSGKGLGVTSHPDGRVFFVPGVWPGDEGEFEIVKEERRYGFARLKSLLERSHVRREPVCRHHGFRDGECGGCPWMMIPYRDQLKQKTKQLSGALERAGLQAENVGEIWGSPHEFHYRSRAELKTDGQRIGFLTAQSGSLAEVESCQVLDEANGKALSEIRGHLPRQDWVPQGEGSYTRVFLDSGELRERAAFSQANPRQNERMKNWLREKLESLSRENEVTEFFSGNGNFTEVLNELGFEKIRAFDCSKSAIEELRRKKLALAYCQDLFKHPPKVRSPIFLLDPPREGFRKLGDCLGNEVKWIFYVSCDLSSFVRDSKRLIQKGFEIEEIQPIDLFPQTPHIEILSVLRASK